MPLAGVYARISLDRHDGEGVARQLADCRELASERWPGAEIVEYVDNDISAFRANRRPAYERLLADLHAKRLGDVVAYHPDRLYRQLADLESLIDAVQAAAAEVATVRAGDVDLSTASGRMVARILGAVSRQESERIGERVSRAKRERATQGRHSGGGMRPFGLTADRTALVESEAAELRRAAAAVLCGATLSSEVDRLNAAGMRSTTGRYWTVGDLGRVLTSPHVAALRSYRGEVVGEAQWPPILDRDTWEQLRAARGRRKRGRPPLDRHLLTGLLACSECERSLHANQIRDTERFAYRCAPTMTGTGRGCGKIWIAAAPLERLIVAMALEAVDAGALSRAATKRSQQHPGPDPAVIEADLRALAEDHGAGRISRAEWLAARQPLEDRLREAREAADASAAVATVADMVDVDLRDRWPTLDVARQRAILATLIERIVIHPATVAGGAIPTVEGIGRIDVDRVEVRWRA